MMKISAFTKTARERGFVLPVLMTTTLMITLMIVAVGSAATLTYNLANSETYKINAQMVADAGLDKALIDLTLDSDYLGTGAEVELLSTSRTRTTYETTVLPGVSTDRRIIRVVGRSYGNPSTKLRSTRIYELDAQSITTNSNITSVVSGVGGLILNSNAKISGGDVIVNGSVTIANNAQIGLQTNPVNVRVAHTSCPNPVTSSYPRVCGTNENGEPITISNDGRIYGTVHATNQTNGTNMFNPGLVPNQTVPPATLPDYDRAGQQGAVTPATTFAPSDSTVSCGNNQNKTWPANVRITGNISLGNGCTVTLSGNTWIDGNLTFGNNSRIVVANTLGTNRPTVMIDGSSGINFGNNASILPNSSDTGVFFITYWSAAGCSPNCTTVTGTELANSQTVRTIDLGSNGNAAGTVLYARWSKVSIANNGAIGAVAGQTVELGNFANITFTTSIPGSTTAYTTWVKRGYMRVYQ